MDRDAVLDVINEICKGFCIGTGFFVFWAIVGILLAWWITPGWAR